MIINGTDKIKTDEGIYIELVCDKLTKERLNNYVRKYIDPVSDFDDFHTTLIYSKNKFEGNVTVDLSLDKIYTKAKEFKKFINQDGTTAVVLELQCLACIELHNTLMKSYDFKYDFDEYIPHITLTYDGANVDTDNMPLPNFMIKFDTINIEPLNANYVEEINKK